MSSDNSWRSRRITRTALGDGQDGGYNGGDLPATSTTCRTQLAVLILSRDEQHTGGLTNASGMEARSLEQNPTDDEFRI